MSDQEIKPIETKKIRKIGSGRKKGSVSQKDRYILEFEGRKYICKSQNEIASICNRSRMCISRIIRGDTTFRKKTSEDLKKIKINKIL